MQPVSFFLSFTKSTLSEAQALQREQLVNCCALKGWLCLGFSFAYQMRFGVKRGGLAWTYLGTDGYLAGWSRKAGRKDIHQRHWPNSFRLQTETETETNPSAHMHVHNLPTANAGLPGTQRAQATNPLKLERPGVVMWEKTCLNNLCSRISITSWHSSCPVCSFRTLAQDCLNLMQFYLTLCLRLLKALAGWVIDWFFVFLFKAYLFS